MSRGQVLGLAAALFVAGATGSCGKGKPQVQGDGGPTDSGPADGSGSALTACLDRPDSLDRPPDGRLPCELIPPGLRLP